MSVPASYRCLSHRGTLLRALALAVAMLTLAVSAASAEDNDPKYSDKRLGKWLKNELRANSLEPKSVSSCRPKRGKRVMVCKWRAKGVWPGDLPYECAGKARFTVNAKEWELDPCNNIEEPRMPLRDGLGPEPLFGFNEDWVHKLGGIDLLAGTGANVARTGLYWDAVQPTSFDVRVWTLFDGLYHQMLARGVRPLFVLHAAPCWAQSGSCRQGAHPSPDHYDELADFAARAAQRYPQAVGIEVWNEPNYEIYWGGTPDPESYGEMLKTVVPAIKAANPNMPVVTAGLSPHINDAPDAMAYETFLRRTYATGGPQLADAIGTHPYPNRRYIEDYLGNVRVNLFRYLRVMKDFGDENKPFWVTETGVSNDGEEGFSPDQQANALAQIYDVMRRIDHEIPVVVYHRFFDQPGDPRVKERGYGVVGGNGELKPAYCAVASVRTGSSPC